MNNEELNISQTNQMNRIGDNLANILGMKRDHEYKDRWQTNWGTKTGLGLIRLLTATMDQIKDGNPHEDLLR